MIPAARLRHFNLAAFSELFPQQGAFVIPDFTGSEYLIPGSFERLGDETSAGLLAVISLDSLFTIKDAAGGPGAMMELYGSANPSADVVWFRGIVGAGFAGWASTPALDFNGRHLLGGWNALDGMGFYGTSAPSAQPATPSDLGEVIALLQSFGLCA